MQPPGLEYRIQGVCNALYLNGRQRAPKAQSHSQKGRISHSEGGELQKEEGRISRALRGPPDPPAVARTSEAFEQAATPRESVLARRALEAEAAQGVRSAAQGRERSARRQFMAGTDCPAGAAGGRCPDVTATGIGPDYYLGGVPGPEELSVCVSAQRCPDASRYADASEVSTTDAVM